jgi:UDP-2,3-diacylglucosamine pyrophosphatase LpxH
MTTIILSDLHLGARNSRGDLITRVLRTDFDQLILNGDTVNSLNFDRFRRTDWKIVRMLQEIARERDLVLIRGNHDGDRDETGEEFSSLNLLGDLLGTELREDYEVAVSGGRYLIMHGDQFDHTLNLTWVGKVADWCYNRLQEVSKPTARWLKSRVKHTCGVVDAVIAGGIPYARERDCIGFIAGHTHYPDDETIDGIRYLNTGCWVDSPCTYVRIERGHAELLRWDDRATVSQSQLELVGAS